MAEFTRKDIVKDIKKLDNVTTDLGRGEDATCFIMIIHLLISIVMKRKIYLTSAEHSQIFSMKKVEIKAAICSLNYRKLC